MDGFKIAGLAAPVALMLILRVIYMMYEGMPNKAKRITAIVSGVGVAFLIMGYQEMPFTFQQIVNAVFYGLTIGLAAIGAYEATKKEGLPG